MVIYSVEIKIKLKTKASELISVLIWRFFYGEKGKERKVIKKKQIIKAAKLQESLMVPWELFGVLFIH